MANRYYNRNRYDDRDFKRDDQQGYNEDDWYNRRSFGRGMTNDRYGNNQNFNRSGYDTGMSRYYTDRDYDSRRYYGTDQDQGDWYNTDFTPSYTYTEYWFIPGPYQGVGPSGYHRSDDRIKDDIHERLTRHGRIDARNIQVDVDNGEVTLKGQVHSRQEKRMAEDVVDSVSGVSDVNNQLKIEQKNQWQGKSQRSQSIRQHAIQGGQVRDGMEVKGKNGKKVGTVKEVRQNSFLVDRDMARDVFVPFDRAHASEGNVILEVTADQVDNQNWDKPDLF